jgi:hypothetical protein
VSQVSLHAASGRSGHCAIGSGIAFGSVILGSAEI